MTDQGYCITIIISEMDKMTNNFNTDFMVHPIHQHEFGNKGSCELCDFELAATEDLITVSNFVPQYV